MIKTKDVLAVKTSGVCFSPPAMARMEVPSKTSCFVKSVGSISFQGEKITIFNWWSRKMTYTPLKTNVTGWKITNFNGKYIDIFIHGGFSHCPCCFFFGGVHPWSLTVKSLKNDAWKMIHLLLAITMFREWCVKLPALSEFGMIILRYS